MVIYTRAPPGLTPAQLKAMGQAMLGPIRLGQNHGLNMALALPEILESQSQWLRPQLLGAHYMGHCMFN